MRVLHRSRRSDLEPLILQHTLPGTTVNSDEWGAYDHLDENQRPHATVNHSLHEWARDDDGDGIREVHNE